MSRGAKRAAAQHTRQPKRAQRGLAYAIGWYCFLAFVVLTPLIIAILPSQVGALAQYRGFDIFVLPKAVAILVLSGLSLVALCVSVVRGESELRWHPVLWVLLGIFGWAGVSTMLSSSPARSVWGAAQGNEGLAAVFGYGLVAFLAIQYVRSTAAVRAVAVTAVVSGSLVSAYALVQYAGVDPMAWIGELSRVGSTYGNADTLGTYLIFPLSLALGLALSTVRGWRSLAWWAAVVAITAALLATATRGAWIGTLVACACIGAVGWGVQWQVPLRRKLVIGGSAIAAVAASAAVIVLTRTRAAESATTLASALSRLSNGRTVIWATGLRGSLAHPVTGWGPDAFERAFQSVVGADWFMMVGDILVPHTAHNFLVQTLVSLGIPGLVLTVWALGYAAAASFAGVQSAKGPTRLLLVVLWGAFIGMIVALFFGVTVPGVSVWLWLTAGLLLAPVSRRVHALPKVVPVISASAGVVLALWAGSWLVADVIVGRAMQMPPSPVQVAEFERAARINPLTPNYKWQVAEGIVNEAVAAQRAGQSRQTVDAMMLRGIEAFDVAVRADRGDPMVRTAFANVLVGYATLNPVGDAAQRAVQVAEEAVSLAPRNPAVLGALARAYKVAGRRDDAERTARLARSIAPEYSMQTLGTLGLETTTTP